MSLVQTRSLPVSRRAIILEHLAAALLMAGPAIGLALGIKLTQDAQTRFALQLISLILAVPLGYYLYIQSRKRTQALSPLDLVFYSILIAGIPMAIMNMLNPADPNDAKVGASRLVSVASFEARSQLLFVMLLLLRALVLYQWTPRSGISSLRDSLNRMMGWTLAACTTLNLLSLQFAFSTGIGLSSVRRLGEDDRSYMSMNTASGFATLAAALAITLPLKWWIRYPALLLGIYITLLTQSRGALAGLIFTMVLTGALALWQTDARRRAMILAWIGGLVVLSGALIPAASQIGPVQRMIARTQAADPTTGRVSILSEALDLVTENPVLGVGWSSPGTRFENGPLSLAVEIGVPATFFTYALVFWTMFYAFRMIRSPDPDTAYVGKICAIMLTFLFLRGLTERMHIFQLSNSLSNLWLFLTGLIVQQHLTSRQVIRARYTAPLQANPSS